MSAFFLWGFGATASLFPGRMLKNTAHTSLGNPVEFEQSDDDFEAHEVFQILCLIGIRLSVDGRDVWSWD